MSENVNPNENTSSETQPAEAQPAEHKPREGKSGGSKSGAHKSGANRSGANRPRPDGQRPRNGSGKRRRRKAGVPSALVAALLVIALFFGGLMGFVVANRTNTYRTQLEEAEERVTELENLLTMIGYSEDEDDDESFIFDDSDSSDEFGDLSGDSADTSDVLWGEDSLEDSTSLEDSLLEDTGEELVVAEFDGGELLSSEVIEPYNDEIAILAFGFGDTDESAEDILLSVMEELVTEKIAYLKAEELGLTEITDEDVAAIEEEMTESYEELKSFYLAYVDTDGLTDEEAEATVTEYMEDEYGISVDSLVEAEKENYWLTKLFNYVVSDVTVSEEEVQEYYDSLLETQTEMFTESSDDYEFSVLCGEIIVYNLEGYRRVKHILLAFDDLDVADEVQTLTDEIAALNSETDFDEITELQEELNALYEELDEQADAIIEELNAGADFDELIEKYGDDDAMLAEPTSTNGYVVSANSTTQYEADFVEACMMLESIGDVSVPIHTVEGVHIIKYIGDVEAGAVALEDVYDAIEAEVLAEKQEEYYEEQLAEWVEEANVVYYPELLQ